ncbi:MAG: amino acid ABC transporter substrate-binding protein, partial [Methanocorpusculaceae archaeon]|nr:amino acid ABC transporter substrate-binding protein [Methanocorpusculaceae archaeon]
MKILSVLLLLFLGLTIFSSGCIGTEETKTYVVGVSPGYPPFVYYDTNGELQGIDIESIQWIAEQEGFEIEFEVIEDWDKLIPSLLAGKIDVIYSGMTITEERAKRVAFSDPYWEVFYDIAVRSNTEWTMDDFLAGRLVISVTDGSTA